MIENSRFEYSVPRKNKNGRHSVILFRIDEMNGQSFRSSLAKMMTGLHDSKKDLIESATEVCRALNAGVLDERMLRFWASHLSPRSAGQLLREKAGKMK